MRLLAKLLGQHPQVDWLRLEESATEVHVSAVALEALAMSHGDLANLLRTALRTLHPGEKSYVWTRDVYDAAVVYELSSRDEITPTALYQRSYAITDGAVTFGDPIKVIAVTQYMPAEGTEISMPATQVTQVSQPAAESGEVELTTDLVPLVEAAVKKDGTATIKIIQAGQGSSGYYPADVLKRDGPKAFSAGLHVYLDHPSVSEESNRPERSVKDLAGSLTGPATWQETGSAGPGLYAPVKFIDSVAPHINAISSISGMSIRAAGKAGTREIDGKRVRSIESIDVAHSVDVVTKAGAGGKVLDLVESARNRAQPPKGEDDVSQQELDDLKKKLEESESREAARDTELSRLREANVVRDANGIVIETMAGFTMPELTRKRLLATLAANPPLKEGAIDREAFVTQITESVTAELAYLTEASGVGVIRGMGSSGDGAGPNLPTLEESDKRIKAALAGL